MTVELNLLFDQKRLLHRRKKIMDNNDFPDFIMRETEAEILERLAYIKREFTHAVILGPATAEFSRQLSDTGKIDTITHIAPFLPCDIVMDEIVFAVKKNAVDLIVAPSGLEWQNDLPGMFLQIRQALKDDGLFVAALWAGETLKELRAAWLAAEAEMSGGAGLRVAPFAHLRDLGNLLHRAGFALPVADMERRTVRYGSALKLMQELKQMGLSNAMVQRPRHLVSGRLLAAVHQYYHQHFADPDGKVRASFEFAILTAWAPDESQQKPLKPGSAKMRLADALKTEEVKLTPSNKHKPA